MKMKKIMVAVTTLTVLSLTATTAFAATPKYEYSFDGSMDGAQTMSREGDNENGGNVGTMPAVDSSANAQFDAGKNGEALFLDGSYGVVLDAQDVGTSYSISFWVNPSRFSNYGPILQLGSDLLSENASSKWLNVTKTDWDGDSCPIIWSRNEALSAELTGDGAAVWPWYLKAYFTAGGGYSIPKNEWSHITITVDGATVGMDPALETEVIGTVHSQLYVNGELIGEGPVADEIFTDDALIYLGINAWDIKFKGLFDDIKIYDVALTADEVATAMNEPAVATNTATSVPKTGVTSMALLFGLGATVLGTGSAVLKRKEK